MVKYGSSSSVATKEEETMKWDGRNHPFIEFDQFIMNWCRTKWNNETGKALWEDTYPEAMHTGANAKAAWASPFCFPIAARGSNGVSIDAKSSV